MTKNLTRVLMVGLLLCMTSLAHAEDKQAARSQEQLRRLRQQVQQLQQAQQTQQQSEQKVAQEKALADEQLKRRSSELGSARQRLTTTERQLADLDARFKATEQERDALTAKLSEASKQLAELSLVQRDTAGKLATRDSEAKGLQISLTGEMAERSRCEANNVALYQYGRELLSLYENKGVVTALRQREPVFGMGQVSMQNMLEEYRDKLDAQKRAAAQTDVKADSPVRP